MHSRINIKRVENKLRSARTRMGQGGTQRRAVKPLSEVLIDMEEKGIDVNEEKLRGRSKTRKRFREQDTSIQKDSSVVSAKKHVLRYTGDRSKARSASRLVQALPDPILRVESERKKRKTTRALSKQGKKGEADRWIPDWKPKHLYSGKTGSGTRDRR